MTRTITLEIQNEYIIGDKVLIGAAGSHNDVVLRMEFSPMWDGLTKTVQFGDALGESSIETLLTANLLEGSSTMVYLVPVPSGAKKYAGKMTLAVKGAAVSGEKETRATMAVYGTFTVADSKWDADAEEEQDIPATQAEQLQNQIDVVLDTIADAKTAASTATTKADEAAASADEAADSASAAAKSAVSAEEWAAQIVQTVGHRKLTLSLPAASWEGRASPYTQSVTITGGTAATQVDLQADAALLEQLSGFHVTALLVRNDNAAFTAVAVGGKPTADLTIQATAYDVEVS